MSLEGRKHVTQAKPHSTRISSYIAADLASTEPVETDSNRRDITLRCLVEDDDPFRNYFEVKIGVDASIAGLKDVIKQSQAPFFDNVASKDLQLWQVDASMQQIKDKEYSKSKEIIGLTQVSDYWKRGPPSKCIHVMIALPSEILSLEEALSCIPPVITYSTFACTSSSSTKPHRDFDIKKLHLWKTFLDEVKRFRFDQQPKFKRPQFNNEFDNAVNEEDVREALHINICQVLNGLLKPEYHYSRRKPDAPGIPDFTCHLNDKKLLVVVEVKRRHVLEDMDEQTLIEFYDENAKLVIQQVFNYMADNQLQYAVLSTYERHWFFKRPSETPSELYISKTLLLQSKSPPVLKAYAYLALQAKDNPHSRNPLIIPGSDDEEDQTDNTYSKHPRVRIADEFPLRRL